MCVIFSCMLILHGFSGHVSKPGECVFSFQLYACCELLPVLYIFTSSVLVYSKLCGPQFFSFSFSVMKCLNLAKANGYKYFGLQFYGECWASNDNSRYRKYGQVTNCYHGLGSKWTNYVYKIVE